MDHDIDELQDTLAGSPDALRREGERLEQQEAQARAAAERQEAALDRARAHLSSRRAELEALSGHASPRRLPLLDQVQAASPCPMRWDEMQGDNRTRHCGKCSKNVYNLSAMTRQEAESFLLASGANACVRFYRRSDGGVMTSDCAQGRRRRLLRTGAFVALAAGVTAAVGSGWFFEVMNDWLTPEPEYIGFSGLAEPPDSMGAQGDDAPEAAGGRDDEGGASTP